MNMILWKRKSIGTEIRSVVVVAGGREKGFTVKGHEELSYIMILVVVT